MKRALLATVSALVVSLGINAWQLSRGGRGDQNADRHASISTNRLRGREGDSRTGGRLHPDSLEAKRGRGSAAEAKSGAPKTLSEILAMRDPLDRYEALLAFVRRLPSDQIGEMLKELRSGSSKLDGEARLIAHLLLTRWGQEDPEAAFASLGKVNAKRGGGDAITILAALAATDPARAVAWLSDPENGLPQQAWMGHMLARTIAEEWARQDSDAALAWAASLSDSEQRSGAYAGIIGNLLERNPERAAAIALALDPADRPNLLGEIAETWARQAPEAAVAWANSLNATERAEALSNALGGWAATAPAEAAAYVDSLPAEERGDHVGRLGRTWAQEAPAEAAAWLGTQEESVGRADAMGHVMWNWTNVDPEAAADWLGEQPAGPSYDNGVAGLAKAATNTFDDPETGVGWASTIENEQLRTAMTQHTLGRWMRQDPVAAQAWAAEQGVELPAAAARRGK
jgi:hypothetical protein